MPALFETLPKEFVSDTVFYDYKVPVTEALASVRKLGAVVVLHDKEYYGIVDDRSVFRTRGLKPLNFQKNSAVGKFSRKLPVLDSNTSLGRLIGYFHDFSAKALPYSDGKKVVGVVKREVVISTIISLHLLAKTKVSDVMSLPLITIGPDSNVAQATNVMEKNKIAKLVVAENERMTGLLSQRDVTGWLAKPQERLPEKKSYAFSPANLSVKSVMKTAVYTVDFNRSAEDAARLLLEKKVSSLVVMRGPKPVGMISMRDVIESAAATTAKTQSKVIISGLDEYTGEHEQPVRDAANRLVARIDKFERLDVDYVAVNVKRHRERNYEMSARLVLQRRGTVFARATGYSLDSTLSQLVESIYKRIKGRKETLINNKRLGERYYAE